MDIELANRARDRRLRRKILSTLKLALATSPEGGLSGRTLRDCVDGVMPSGQRTEDDDHALRLCREMAAKGLIAEEAIERRRGQRFGIDFLFFRITAKGIDLWNENLPVDRDVEDERVEE